MTPLEKNILKTIKKNLLLSTQTSWKSGNLDDWSEFAERMKNSIMESANLFDTLISDDENPGAEKH